MLLYWTSLMMAMWTLPCGDFHVEIFDNMEEYKCLL